MLPHYDKKVAAPVTICLARTNKRHCKKEDCLLVLGFWTSDGNAWEESVYTQTYRKHEVGAETKQCGTKCLSGGIDVGYVPCCIGNQ